MSKRAEATWVVLGFTCLAVISSWPLVSRLADHVASDLGDPLLTAWTLAWDAERLRHGLTRLWDAPNFYPYHHTLLYSDHLLGIAIFTAPIQWLTGNAVLGYNVAFLATFVLSGAGMYLLVRDLTGRRDAAALAGVIYACQPFRAIHVSHLQWLMTGWLPLSLWALHRYFRSRRARDLLLATAFYLLQALTASYFTYFALVPLLVVGLLEWRRTRLPLRTLAKHLAPAIVLTAVTLGPIVRAYYELRVESGLHRTDEEIRMQSADVSGYISPPSNVWLWTGRVLFRGEREVFPGAVAIVLAVFAIVAAMKASVGNAERAEHPENQYARSPRARPLPEIVAVYATVAAVAFVLSLGPAPTAWGHSLGVSGPYAWLLRIVPGLDGLRVPARLALVVQLAFAVLAAIGYARLADRLSPRMRTVVLGVAMIVVFFEGWPGPMDTPPFNARGVDIEREAYAYLRRLPAGPAIELPTSILDPAPEFKYQYMTIVHGHPVVNGHSGYVSPLVVWLGGGHSPLRELDQQRDAIDVFRGLGVRYLVVHRRSYQEAALADAMIAALNADGAPVVESRTFNDVTVAVLMPLDLPAAPAPLSAVPIASIHVQASHGNDRVPLMFDGDVDTRWVSGGPQTGTEQIDLELDRPRDVRMVRLRIGARSFGDYPRELSIDAIEPDGTRTLYRGSVLPQLARGIVADEAYPFIDIVLPPNRARALRLRQLGATRVFFWSIHELQLLERL